MIFYKWLFISHNPVGKRKKRNSVAFPLAIPIRLPKQPTEYPSPAVRACESCAHAQGGGGMQADVWRANRNSSDLC